MPETMNFRGSPLNDLQRTQSLRTFERPSYLRTPVRAIHTHLIINPPAPVPLPPPRLGQTGVHHPSEHPKYDPLTGLMINASTTDTNSNGNFEQSYLTSASIHSRPLFDRDQPPPVPPRGIENSYAFPRRSPQYDPARLRQQLLEVRILTGSTDLILGFLIGGGNARFASFGRRRWSTRRFYGE